MVDFLPKFLNNWKSNFRLVVDMTEEMDGNRNNQTEMASSEPENPFASLFFGTIPVAPIEKTSDDISNQQVLEPNEVQLADGVDEQTGTKDDYLFDEMVQSVFLFTVNECQQTTTGEFFLTKNCF